MFEACEADATNFGQREYTKLRVGRLLPSRVITSRQFTTYTGNKVPVPCIGTFSTSFRPLNPGIPCIECYNIFQFKVGHYTRLYCLIQGEIIIKYKVHLELVKHRNPNVKKGAFASRSLFNSRKNFIWHYNQCRYKDLVLDLNYCQYQVINSNSRLMMIYHSRYSLYWFLITYYAPNCFIKHYTLTTYMESFSCYIKGILTSS